MEAKETRTEIGLEDEQTVAARRKRRKVVKPHTQFDGPINPREHELLQLALANSRTHSVKEDWQIPAAPEFYPTAEEFSDPIRYISR